MHIVGDRRRRNQGDPPLPCSVVPSFRTTRPAPTPAFWNGTYELMATWPAVFSVLERGHHPIQRPPLFLSSLRSETARLAPRFQTLVSGIWYLVSGIWYLVSAVWYLHGGRYTWLTRILPCNNLIRPETVGAPGHKSQDASTGRTSNEAPDVSCRGL
jgi:hypothetical protein